MKIILAIVVFHTVLFSAPLNESFTQTTFPPVGWRVINNDGGGQIWQRDTNNPRTQPACASSRFESNTLRNDDWLITPKIICSPLSADTLKFWYRKLAGGNPESLEVWLSNTTNNINAFTTLLWKIRFTTTTYTQKTIPLDSFDGQEIYLAFVNKALYGNRLNLDDITGPEMSEISDVGVDSILCPTNTFTIRPTGSGFLPQARIKNYSNTTQRNIPVVCSIIGQSSTLRYQSVKYIDSLLLDGSTIITFDLFTPNVAELCTVKVRTFLANDSNLANNIKTTTTQIIRGQYTGGPDDGFYYWVDSDTTGGPGYNWIDLSLSGAPLVSGDAYVAGPIPIGFPFNYYGNICPYIWYSTNGFITLDEISLSYNTNSPIPNNNLPNSIIAPFWEDLYTYQARHQTFGSAPNRYKIVQWKSIVYAQAVLRDTVIFQVILHENGDIVFQYNYRSNRYNLGLGQSATIGIENSDGTAGLQYLYNGTNQGNLLNAGRAVKFYRSFHDVMLDTILTGYVGLTQTIRPKIVVKNIGTFSETFSTLFNIRNSTQTLIYADTCEIINLAPAASCTVTFKQWTPVQLGTYPAKAWTTLADDLFRFNDTCSQDIIVTLAAPGLLNPINGYLTNNRNILFDWTDVSQASRYNLVIDGIIDTIMNFSQYGPRNFAEGSYSWRVRAGNQSMWGLWSEAYTFTIDTTRPLSPILIAPLHNCTLSLPRPNFLWHQISDAVQYNILIYSLYDTITNQTITDTNFTPPQTIPNGICFWKVRCQDLAGNWSDYSQTRTLYLQYETWSQRWDIPELSSGKAVGVGGSLVATEFNIMALKGNNTQDFYAYDIPTNSWIFLELIPFVSNDTVITVRKVKAGGALTYGNGLVFALKGNNTKEFWAYHPIDDSWVLKKEIPSMRSVRDGSSLVYANGSVYCLVGHSNKFEFFRFEITSDSWIKLCSAPAGRFHKRFRGGSCMTYAGNNKIHVLKGSARLNEFYAYDITNDFWQEKESLPYFHPMIRKKSRVKSGGAMCYDGQNSIYAIKGGGRNEFWQYNLSTGQWLALETIPRLDRQSVPKAGASLAYLNGKVWLLKGNKTREFWCYEANKSASAKITPNNAEMPSEKNEIIRLPQNDMTDIIRKLVVTDHQKHRFRIACNITDAGKYLIKCYNLNGQCVKNFGAQFLKTGSLEQEILFDNMTKGVYFIVVSKNF